MGNYLLVLIMLFGFPHDLYRQLPIQPNIELAQNYACSPKKTCGQMRSCSEAVYHLYQCGDRKRDGDSDGIPCEKLCGKTQKRMRALIEKGL